MALIATLLLAAILLLLAWLMVGLRDARREAAALAALQTFAAARAAAFADPRQLIVWYPLAQAARRLQPEAFARLDAALGATFPFAREDVERAHARVSTDWLAWEKAHDEEYRVRAAAAEHELTGTTGEAAALVRARLDRIQHEKVERYQLRYEEYIRAAKALQALLQ